MAGNLHAFLAQNTVRPENVKQVVSERFIGEDGKPVEWELRPLTGKEIDAITRKHTRLVQVPGKRGQYQQELDGGKCAAEMTVACTVFPNLHDRELQDSYGAMGAEELLQMMLLSGEYMRYQRLVQELNQIVSFDEQMQEAKN